ncbi:MAG: histidinol dehydrogenase [Flavobacteriales bacterium]|nr:histidinol dehydrogenase [Flavobacteriales bacterium]
METIINPSRSLWAKLTTRPRLSTASLEETCAEVFKEVEKEGDKALSRYTEMFDGAVVEEFAINEKEIAVAQRKVPATLQKAILSAKENIERFHSSQIRTPEKVETTQGVTCWQEIRPIDRVGLYIPGGSAPLFSTVLMLAVPAKIAGCKEIILCTPPTKDGSINPVVLWTAIQCGVTKIFKVGGIQAIAAMTFGTKTIPAVYKIFGPGNQYVMAAKQTATRHGVAIDMPAGPSEVLVIADKTADAQFVASDLLSQAEHGPDSQVVLITPYEDLIPAVEKAIEAQLKLLPRKEVAMKALSNSKMILLKNIAQCVEFSNMYAPEHLILCVEDYMTVAKTVTNAGSVFLGNYSPESAGDYASGTNHTLPTSAYARSYSGVNMDAFTKKITFQHLSEQGLASLGHTIELMAENEHLDAHKNAVTIRIKKK